MAPRTSAPEPPRAPVRKPGAPRWVPRPGTPRRRRVSGGPAPRLRVVADVAGASVFVDRQPIGSAPIDVETSPGSHKVRGEAPGHAATTIVAGVVEGRTNEIAAVLGPLEDGSELDDGESIVESWWLWTIVGAVVAGGAITAGVPPPPDDARPAADFSAWMR